MPSSLSTPKSHFKPHSGIAIFCTNPHTGRSEVIKGILQLPTERNHAVTGAEDSLDTTVLLLLDQAKKPYKRGTGQQGKRMAHLNKQPLLNAVGERG